MIDLEEATRALREESDGASVGAVQTRARVMRSLHEGTHRRRVRWGFGIPLAVVFAGSTAFAGARGDLGPTIAEALSSVRAMVTGAPTEAPQAPTPPSQRAPAAMPSARSTEAPSEIATPPAPPELRLPAPVDAPVPAPQSVSAPTTPERAARTPKTAASNLPRATENAPATPAESNEATRLYRKAHDAQFVQGDCVHALAAYDDYLTAAPRDRLVPEARYNRALCLVRLGRADAARSALQPFAEGAYGDYRRREARELLDALDAP